MSFIRRLNVQCPLQRGSIKRGSTVYLIRRTGVFFIFIYCFTAQVLKVCRTPGPTACSKTKMVRLDARIQCADASIILPLVYHDTGIYFTT